MSTAEVAVKEPKKSPQDASKSLTDAERNDLQKKLANPLDFPPEFRTWLEGTIESVLPTSAALKALAANIAFPVGYFRIVPEDLSANTGEYVWTDSDTGLQFLYCNGVSGGVSQTDYADLYAKWGPNKYGADSGGNFMLPDLRGRPIWFTGTNTAADLGDNDGVAEASRTPAQTDLISITISGTTGTASAAAIAGAAGASATSDNHTHSFSGSDTDTANITVPNYFIGSLVVRF